MAFVNTVAKDSTAATKVALSTPRLYLVPTRISVASKTTPTTGQIWPRRGS